MMMIIIIIVLVWSIVNRFDWIKRRKNYSDDHHSMTMDPKSRKKTKIIILLNRKAGEKNSIIIFTFQLFLISIFFFAGKKLTEILDNENHNHYKHTMCDVEQNSFKPLFYEFFLAINLMIFNGENQRQFDESWWFSSMNSINIIMTCDITMKAIIGYIFSCRILLILNIFVFKKQKKLWIKYSTVAKKEKNNWSVGKVFTHFKQTGEKNKKYKGVARFKSMT